MLSALLQLIRSSGTLSTADLARRLEVSPKLVEAMLEALAREGRLTDLGRSCPGSCGGCRPNSPCLTPAQGRIWRVIAGT